MTERPSSKQQREMLARLRMSRAHDPAIPARGEALPDWLMNPYHPAREAYRRRERRMRLIEERLRDTGTKLLGDFDRSR